MKMVTLRNTGAPAVVRGLFLLEDETCEVAAGLVAGLQAQYPQLVVATASVEVAETREATESSVSVVEAESKPKAKAKK